MPAVTLITSVPNFASTEDYNTLVRSTPTSFGDIPPVLRHKEENVAISLDPPIDGLTPEDSTHGTLYVLTSVLVYMSTTGRGFQIEYPAITLHAVSRAESGPSIYCQLDEHLDEANSTPNNEDEDDVTDMRELNIIPQSSSSLEPIFEALSQCASLHPDKDAGSEDDDDDAFLDPDGRFDTFDGNEEQELSEVGRAALAHLESIIYDPNGPPEEDEDEDEGGVNGVGNEGVSGAEEKVEGSSRTG